MPPVRPLVVHVKHPATLRLARLLDSPRAPYLASAITLALGLFFIFVWAPHPWDWRGIDQYHNLARDLARGEPFGTTDVPWGYAYFVAAFYALFGQQEWLPVVAQALANATIPVMVYWLALPLTSQRTAALAALLTGVLSFNTIYASTQASDAICTVLFVAAVLWFANGARRSSAVAFAVSGLLAGLVPQFRPNLVLLPWIVAAAYLAWPVRSSRKVGHMAVFLAVVSLALAPWVVRNYRLTGLFLPTSTHGAIQLWYGSLQVGPYLESWSRNPRTAVVTPAFRYTSLGETSIIVSADLDACGNGEPPVLTYWTDHDPRPRTVAPSARRGHTTDFRVPGQPIPTALYYRLGAGTPPDESRPSVFFVSNDHLGDMDRHGDLLDVFDIVRLLRHLAWDEALPHTDRLDVNDDGVVDAVDLEIGVTHLLNHGYAVEHLESNPTATVLHFVDGSSLSVPRRFSGHLSELEVEAGLAVRLLSARLPFAEVRSNVDTTAAEPCPSPASVRVNDVFYRREVDQMRRYLALALDNIRHEPVAFAMAAVYRAGRLFIIRSTDDPDAVYRFTWSRAIYAAGMVASTAYFFVFAAGVVLAWRRRSPLIFLLLPILYIPATIAVVLTNQRYSVTVQPLMFIFMAVAVVAALRLEGASGAPERKFPVSS